MWIIKCLLLFGFLSVILSCNKVKYLDDSELLKRISCKSQSIVVDSMIFININITNNSDRVILIPNYWYLDGKVSNSYTLFAQPDNPYLWNTVHYFPQNSNLLNGIAHMGVYENINRFPYFFKANKNDSITVKLSFPRYFPLFKNDTLGFVKGNDYTFLLKLSVISKENIELMMNSNSIDKNIFELTDSINLVNTYNSLHTYKNQTIIPIESINSEMLNILANNKKLYSFSIFIPK